MLLRFTDTKDDTDKEPLKSVRKEKMVEGIAGRAADGLLSLAVVVFESAT